MSFLSEIDTTTVLVITIIAVIILLAIVFLVSRRKRESPPAGGPEDLSGRPIGSLDYKPGLQPVKETKTLPPSQAAGRPPDESPRVIGQIPVKEIELVEGRADITGSLLALAEKYSLDQFTIATKDGLVFASSGSKNAQNDAAVYSSMYSDDPGTIIPGVVLFELVHKNSGLVGIIRTDKPVPERILAKIAADTKDILNWWI
jgi:hypothetical protein